MFIVLNLRGPSFAYLRQTTEDGLLAQVVQILALLYNILGDHEALYEFGALSLAPATMPSQDPPRGESL